MFNGLSISGRRRRWYFRNFGHGDEGGRGKGAREIVLDYREGKCGKKKKNMYKKYASHLIKRRIKIQIPCKLTLFSRSSRILQQFARHDVDVAVPFFFSIYVRVLHYYYYYYYIVAQPSGLEHECANLISFPFFFFFYSVPERKRKKTSTTARGTNQNTIIYIYMYAIITLYYDQYIMVGELL